MGTVYSVQFYADSFAAMASGVDVPIITGGTTSRQVIREIILSAIFGAFGDTLSVSLAPAASGLPLTLVELGGTSPPAAIIQSMRLVLQPGDVLSWRTDVSGLPAKGGVIVSGYNLTLP